MQKGMMTNMELQRPALTYNTSDQTGELFAAMATAQLEIKNAHKDSANPYFNSKYADLASVGDACKAALSAQKIAVIQMPYNSADAIGVTTLLGHSSGQWLSCSVQVKPDKFTAQAVGSVITYLRRYSLAAIAGVAQEDDDGNAATGDNKRDAGKQTNGQANGKKEQPPLKGSETPTQKALADLRRCFTAAIKNKHFENSDAVAAFLFADPVARNAGIRTWDHLKACEDINVIQALHAVLTDELQGARA